MPPKAAPKPTPKAAAPAAKAPAAKPSAPAAKAPAAKAAATKAAAPAPKAAAPAAKAANVGAGNGVYIKNFGKASVEEVKKTLAGCGNIADVRLRRNKFALVWFDGAAGAKKAIDSFNGKSVNGKQLTVVASRASPKPDNKAGAVSVFVTPVFRQCTTRNKVRELFKAAGKVVKLRTFRKNFALVKFENAAAAAKAVKDVNGTQFFNKTLIVKPSVAFK